MPKLSESSRLKLEYQSLLSEVDAWIEDCRCEGVEKKIKIALRRNGVESKLRISATVYESLAVHFSEISPTYWVVTHVPTGLFLGRHFKTRRDAERHLFCILHLMDWSKIRREGDIDVSSVPLAVSVAIIVSHRLAIGAGKILPDYVAELRTLVDLIRNRRQRLKILKIPSKKRSPKTRG